VPLPPKVVLILLGAAKPRLAMLYNLGDSYEADGCYPSTLVFSNLVQSQQSDEREVPGLSGDRPGC